MIGDPAARQRFARLISFFCFTRISGLENVPRSERVIVAMNHSGVIGGMALSTKLVRDIVFMSSVRFFRFPIVRRFAAKMTALFVGRADMLDTRITDEAQDIVAGGSMLGIMLPGLQMTQYKGPPKRGAIYLAYRCKAQLLPVRIERRFIIFVNIEIAPVLPPPSSVRGIDLDQRFDEVCSALRIERVPA